jgi:hypothetical protein
MGMVELGSGSRLYTVRDWLRDMGGKWDNERRVWMIDEKHLEDAKRIIDDLTIGAKPMAESYGLRVSTFPTPSVSSKPAAKVKLPPTEEQAAILAAYKSTDADMIIQSAAGVGKTTTLEMIAEANPHQRFLYLCFNTKNANEAKTKFPHNVTAKTAHSLAYGGMGMGQYKQKLNRGKYDYSWIVTELFVENDRVALPGVSDKHYVDLLRESIKDFESSVDEAVVVDPKGWVAQLVTAVFIYSMKNPSDFKKDIEQVVERYESKYPSLKSRYPEFVAILESIEMDRRRNVLASMRSGDNDAIAAFVDFYQSDLIKQRVAEFLVQLQAHARRYFAILADLESDVPFEHNTYLKLYQLSKPEIRGYDTILFDEGHDANGVILDIVQRQKCRKVWVGDQHQAIYAFMGAVNTIEELVASGMLTLRLTRSFRFGQNIADVANRVLSMKYRFFPWKFKAGCIAPVVGAGGKPMEGSEAVLCRSNVGVLQEALARINESIYFADCLKADYLKSMLDIYLLKVEEPIRNRESQYFGYESLSELKHESYLRGDVDTLRAITLLEKMGPETFREAVESLLIIAKESDSSAQIHIITAHKAKGMEWPKVTLSDDFVSKLVDKDGHLRKKVQEDEINLLYVAVTRARMSVVVPSELKSILRIE